MKDLPKSDSESTYFFYFSGGYGALIESFEHEILLKVEDNDYQGDTRVLLKDGERYGLLFFGWGSCSSCDALAGCDTYEEVVELRDNMYKSIEWLDDQAALRTRIETGEWDLKHSWHADETLEFLNKVAEIAGSTKRFEREDD